mmetsp:Transcript_14351/g.38460  ORF Transcript_14351/g.38460 Transcript_14351/m.38460 type:complete len:93 (-) Transcript_14351:1451-1729(-)
MRIAEGSNGAPHRSCPRLAVIQRESPQRLAASEEVAAAGLHQFKIHGEIDELLSSSIAGCSRFEHTSYTSSEYSLASFCSALGQAQIHVDYH